ncbi:DNA independent RNA polymerase I transcription factor [Coniothyrium glycines]
MVSLASTERALGVVAPGAGGSLKRRHADSSSDAETDSISSLKRRRVTFDPAVNVRILGDENEKSLDLVAEEVRRAIEKHAAGENIAYDKLKGLFSEPPTSPDAPRSSLLQKYLVALTNNVPLLDSSCNGLVYAIIDCSWAARNERFVRTYRSCIRALLSVHTHYVTTVLQMLVNCFMDMPSTSTRQKDDPQIHRSQMQSRIHETLRSIVRQNPIASTQLAHVVTGTFPFSQDTAKRHVEYVRNIFKIAEYAPELKGEILSLVTEKVVKIDVQLQINLEDMADDIDEKLVDEALNAAEDDDVDSDNDSIASDETLNPEEQKLKDIREMMLKLDTVMDVQFAHYDSVWAKGDLFEIDETFESLLSQFANIILPTYRSRHTQFILFHFSQTSSDLIERFAGCCSHLAFDSGRPQLLRASAAAYLASFIARGLHVSGAVVRDVFDLLCHHLEALRLAHEPGCTGPDLRRYSTYYAISQALLYTFCFRWRDLIVTPDGTTPTDADILYHEGDFTWHNSTQETIRRNIFSKFNPLKICAPNIVTQFARMAHHLRFMYIYPLMETNKRVRLARSMTSGYLDGIGGRETALTAKRGEESLLLDAYFPFDPYVLPRSKRWLAHDYVEWKPVPGMPVEDDEDSSDEDEDEEEGEEDDDDSDDASSSESADDEETGLPEVDDESTEGSY